MAEESVWDGVAEERVWGRWLKKEGGMGWLK